MIEVSHLTKRYGGHTAVSDLTFKIEKGLIYGFLGPNGAGKSTTMNIITGCMGATDGEVLIAGHSIQDDPKHAKEHIGYLPEQPPLYVDMTPEEYLRFVAAAKRIPRQERSSQVQSAMEKTGLTNVRKRLIRNLSKGYKQRVGIAQALLGNPEVIILDEPTVGLDPVQIIEIRELIQDLGKQHTVILSSHILNEVQAVCDSIMIISNGKLVASDTPDNLTSLLSGTRVIHLEAKGSAKSAAKVIKKVSHIEEYSLQEEKEDTVEMIIRPENGVDIREAIFNSFAENGIALLEMRTEKASLEDVFLELTQCDPLPEDQKRRSSEAGQTDQAAANGKEGGVSE